MARRKELAVGLDIGTAKTCCIIAEPNEDSLDIIGIGSHPSGGMRKGVVVNIEATVEAVKHAVEEAETMAGTEIESVFVGIAGGHIKGVNGHGIIAVGGGEVSRTEYDRVIETAKAVNIPMDREVIHVIPQEFIVDGQGGIAEPIGMNGVRLEVKVHIITGAVTSAQNIVRSVNRAGLEVNDIVVEQLAASEAVLEADEKELGVGLVDMGGGTCDIIMFQDNAIKGTSVVALGGNNLTNDIAIGLRTPGHEAEKIKRQHGCAYRGLVSPDDVLEVPGVANRPARTLSRDVLSDIIEARVEEIFTLVRNEIELSGYYNKLAAGIVITGGTAIMQGMEETATRILDLPVRIGIPTRVGGLTDLVASPQYATAVGLVTYGAKEMKLGNIASLRGVNMFDKVLGRMKGWVNDFF